MCGFQKRQNIFATRGHECGHYGYWIRDRKRCMRSFAQMSEKALKNLMDFQGFTKQMLSMNDDGKWIFFWHSCVDSSNNGKKEIVCKEFNHSIDSLCTFDDKGVGCSELI